ncbi:hypothetical protein CTI14_49855, partial [Methylobacterium radiotolerans]
GMGVDGLIIGQQVAKDNGMLFVTEVMDTRDVEVVSEYADILQIGARNMHNFGPCSIESPEQMEQTARFLAERGVKILRGGAYKPRTSPYGFQGMGVDGLIIGQQVAKDNGMLFVTEVMDTRDVE